MAQVQFTDKDRDARGFIRIESRSLADLLPAQPSTAPVKPSTPRAQLAIGAIVACTAALLLFYTLGRQEAPAIKQAPTAQSSAMPSAIPTRAQPPMLAYAEPDGALLGPIEYGRAYTPTARLGSEWVQINATGSGLVWVKQTADLSLPDLATPIPAPTRVVIVQQRPIYVPPAPTQCARVSGGGTIVERCGTRPIEALDADARQAWQAEFKGNTLEVATTTPIR